MLFYENNECLAQNILSKKPTDGLDGTVQLSSKITNDHQSLLPKCVSFLLGDFSIESCNGLVSILITIGFNVSQDDVLLYYCRR